MRIWLHTSTKSIALGPSSAVSLLVHGVLAGGAIYGSGRASLALEAAVAERIYYLPPPDRRPSVRPVAERVHYVAPSAGAMLEDMTRRGTIPAGAGGRAALHLPERHGTDDASQERQDASYAPPDSVYSILSVDEGAARMEGSAAPVYPAALVEQRVEGRVRARYVVDTTGRTDPASVEILASTHPAFVASVRDAIPLMRFTPGLVAGRRVRQLVEQEFTFRIVAPPPPAAEHTRALPAP